MTLSERRMNFTSWLKEHAMQNEHREKFTLALQTGDMKTIREYTQDCSHINAQLNGMPPLHHAALHGQFDVVKYLVHQCGADVNTTGTDATYPALNAMLNPYTGSYKNKDIPNQDHIIDFLISEGADLDYADPWYYRSPVYLAVQQEQHADTPDYSLALKLIEHGASPCIRWHDHEGYEPSHYPVDLIPNTEKNTPLRAIFEDAISDEERLNRISEYKDTQTQLRRHEQHQNIQRKQKLIRSFKRK